VLKMLMLFLNFLKVRVFSSKFDNVKQRFSDNKFSGNSLTALNLKGGCKLPPPAPRHDATAGAWQTQPTQQPHLSSY